MKVFLLIILIVAIVQISEARRAKIVRHADEQKVEEKEDSKEPKTGETSKTQENPVSQSNIIQEMIRKLASMFKEAAGGTNMNRNIDLQMKPGKNLVISEQYSQNPGNSSQCLNFVNIQVTILQNSNGTFTEVKNPTQNPAHPNSTNVP